MINKYYDKIQVVEFDLTSTCQAYCASCSRYVIEDGAIKLNPYIKFNKQVSVESMEQIFSSELVADNVTVPMVGSIGDPLAHTNVVEIFETILKHKPNAQITAHTNGGLRTPDIYEQLGKISATSGKKVQIYFSIDGLEDTNHIYREGVIWKKIMENAKAYIDAGGRAKWKYVIFDWNKHQVEQAQQLSKEMGFQEFESILDRSRGEDREDWNAVRHNIKKKETGRLLNQEFRIPIEKRKDWQAPDTTECLGTQTVYITPLETVVPCCKWATGLQWYEHKAEMSEFMYDDNLPNWNSLQHYSFDEILKNKFWIKLGDSVQTSETSCTRCLVQCSKVKV